MQDVQTEFLPWPGLDPWLDALCGLLPAACMWDAWRNGRPLLAGFWLLVAIPAAMAAFLKPAWAGEVSASLALPVPTRLAGVMVLVVYLSLRGYVGGTRRPAWWKVAWLAALRLSALLLAFGVLLRPAMSWSESTTRRGSVAFVLDVSGSMYDVADETDPDAPSGRLSRARAVDAALRKHAARLAALAPPDATGKPRTRVFLFAERFAELPDPKFADGLFARYPGTAAEQARLAADPAFDPKKDPRLGRSATAYGPPLDRVAELLAQEMFTAVVLVGDGADNVPAGRRPEEAARQFRALGLNGARLHTLNVGRSGDLRKEPRLAAEPLKAPDEAPLDSEVTAESKFTLQNLGGRRAKVEFLVDGRPVLENTIDVPAGKDLLDHLAIGRWKTDRPGEHELVMRVTVPPDPGPAPGPGDGGTPRPDDAAATPDLSRLTEELTLERAARVRVYKRGIRVLYVDRIRPEARFTADALARTPDFRVDRVVLTDRPGAAGAAEDSGLPVRLDDWLAYDVVVIGDVPITALTAEQQRHLAVAVRQVGRGLLVMGGFRALGEGGWIADESDPDRTPLASVLPVLCRRGDGQIEGAVRFMPTREGLRDGPCRLTSGTAGAGDDDTLFEDDIRAYRTALPMLTGANRLTWIRPREDGRPDPRFNAVRPGSTVYAVSASDPEAALLVGGRRGRGRVLALAVDTTWQWVLRSGTDEAVRRSTDAHRRLWRQMVEWLVVPKPDLSFRLDGNLHLLSQIRQYRPRVTAALRNFTARQAREVRLTAILAEAPGPDGKPGAELGRFPLQPKEGTFTAELSADWKVGRYQVRLKAENLPPDMDDPGEPTQTFRVEDRDIERVDTAARPAAMENWARIADERSGETTPGEGRAFRLDQFGDLVKALEAGVVEQTTTVRHRKDLLAPASLDGLPYGAWTLFAAAVGLLLAEWLFRKVWGLV